MKNMFLFLLVIITSQAAVIHRKNAEQQQKSAVDSAVDFFAEFNDLFGKDWWKTSDTKQPETNKIENFAKIDNQQQMSKSSQEYQKADLLPVHAIVEPEVLSTDKVVTDQLPPSSKENFDEFTDVFSLDWWGTSDEKKPETNMMERSFKVENKKQISEEYQKDNLYAHKEQVLHYTDPLPVPAFVNAEVSYPKMVATEQLPSSSKVNLYAHKEQVLHLEDPPSVHAIVEPEVLNPKMVPTEQLHSSSKMNTISHQLPPSPPQNALPNTYTGSSPYQQLPYYNSQSYPSPYRALPPSLQTEASVSPATPLNQYFPQPHPAQAFYPPPYFFPQQQVIAENTVEGSDDDNQPTNIQQDGQGVKIEEDAPPTARSYGEDERNKNVVTENENMQAMVQKAPYFSVDPPPPSHPLFYPQPPVAPRHYPDPFFEDNLDDFMARPPSGPLIPAQSSPPSQALSELNYRALLNSLVKVQLDDPLDIMEAEYDLIAVSDDDIPELDDAIVCQTPDGKFGTCVSPTECSFVSGVSSSPCKDPSVTEDLTCCVHLATCGQQSPHQVTYIHNPTTTNLSSCPISIALHPTVCQIRMDFLRMSFLPPLEGFCNSSNSVTLTSSPGGILFHNALCGTISDGSFGPLSTNIPHLYTHFDLNTDPFPYSIHHLNFLLSVSDFPSTLNIRAVQIPCDADSPSPLMANPSCSQWYSSPDGIITSLTNLNTDIQTKVCIKPDPAACAVKYIIHSVECSKEDQVQIMGSDMVLCGVKEKELVLPAGIDMGLLVTQVRKMKLRNCKVDLKYVPGIVQLQSGVQLGAGL